MEVYVVHSRSTCSHCNKKAQKGIVIENETYAEQCAAERLGVTLSTLRKLINKGT
jgi:hypothetical protein